MTHLLLCWDMVLKREQEMLQGLSLELGPGMMSCQEVSRPRRWVRVRMPSLGDRNMEEINEAVLAHHFCDRKTLYWQGVNCFQMLCGVGGCRVALVQEVMMKVCETLDGLL